MQAGAIGGCISKVPAEGWALSERYGVLADIDVSESFVEALATLDEPPPLVFVVTDSSSDFEDVTRRLPQGTRPYRLYESYLRSFEINVEAAK